MNLKTSHYYILLIILGGLLFIPSLGSVHLFDWDEINFAECAREMLVSKDYWQVQIDYKAFWEKPPLFIWMQVLSMKLFGVNEFAARLPNAIVGIASMCVLFFIGRRLRDKKFALIFTLLYTISLLPHFYFKSGIIDPTFNLFIYLSIYFFNASIHHKRKTYYAILCGLSLGLAVLTKGPVAIMLGGLSLITFCALNNFWGKLNFKNLLILSAICILVIGIWVLPNYLIGGAELFNDFINYQIRLLQTQDAGHGGPIYYHLLVLLLGCFPASIFIFQKNKTRVTLSATERDFKLWNVILLSVTLIVFSLVKTKIVHYSSLCYFPITYLSALALYNMHEGKNKWNHSSRISFLVIGVLLAFAFILAPIVMQHSELWIGYVKDPFAIENLKADVEWKNIHTIAGVALLAAVLLTFFMAIKRRYRNAFISLTVFMLLALQSAFRIFPSRIEAISQAAVVDFCERNQDKNLYPIGYKSYAHLFYGKKMPDSEDKEAIFLLKKPFFEKNGLEKDYLILEEKNGYLLLQQR